MSGLYLEKADQLPLFRWMKGLSFLLFILLLTSCASQKTIVHGVDEREANDILVYLSTKGIEAAKTKQIAAGGAGGGTEDKWDIDVNAVDYERSLSLLGAAGFPRRKGDSLLNIFSKGGLVPSDLEEKIRYQAGLAEQIANTIRKIDGVLDASVQIAFPEQDPLNPSKTLGDVKAAVYVKHTGVLDDPNSQLIPRIRRLVSSSIPGLKYDNVTVIPDRARFSDVPFSGEGKLNENKEYVSIWSVIIAKESVRAFRVIFFTFLILALILLLSVMWLGWKFYPLMESLGGYKALLDIHPITPEKIKGVETTQEKTDKEAAEKEAEKKNNDEEGVT